MLLTLLVSVNETAGAATAVLAPDSDVTAEWTVLGGTEDGSCAGGTHCDRVDEGTTANTADYISTGTALTAVTAEFGVTNPANVGAATQVRIFVHTRSATNANGGALDTISINLRIGGALQTAVTVTPAFSTWGWHSATFSGSWSQAQVDGAQVQLVRNVEGGGTQSTRDDDVQLAAAYAEATYSRSSTFEQSAYRWFANTDAPNGSDPVGVGPALAAADTAATAPANGTPFRLRMLLHVSTLGTDPGEHAFKLQVAARGTDNACDSSFTEETYADVSSSSGIVRYFDNTNAVDGQSVAASADDPAHLAHPTVRQTYEEGNNVTASAAVAPGEDALWDFALVTAGAAPGERYCLRVTSSTGTVLSGYSVVPELAIPEPALDQSSYRWFANTDVSSISFVKAAGGAGEERGENMVATSGGGYAIAGGTASFGGGSTDVLLNTYARDGTLSWSRTWGAAGFDIGRAVVQTSDGGFAVTGQTSSYGSGGNDMFLARFDSTGALTWSRTWGGTASDTGESLVQTADGGFAVVGTTVSYSAGLRDVALARFDSAGTLSWSRTWGGAGTDIGYGIVENGDGGLTLSGLTDSFGAGLTDVLLLRYDAAGTLSWFRLWGGAGDDTSHNLIKTADGGYALVGRTTSYGAGGNDVLLGRYDSTGTLLWWRTWGGTGTDSGELLTETSDGGFAVTGETTSFAPTNETFFTRYDSAGTLSYSRVWGSTAGTDRGLAVVQSADGGYVVGGTTSFGAGSTDVVLVKYDATGTIHGCGTACQSPTAGVTSPTPTSSTPTPTTSSPLAGTTAPTAAVSSPVLTLNTAVALGPPIGVGAALAATDTSAKAPADGTPFRLRVGLHVAQADLPAGASYKFKLQVAARGSDNACDTSFTGETYADVTAGSGPVRYYDNPNAVDAHALAASAGDPTHSGHPLVHQTHEEGNDFAVSASVAVGSDGLWDFALVGNAIPAGAVYCLRIVKSDGAPLNGYGIVAVLSGPPSANTAPAAPASLDQRTAANASLSVGAWHNNGSITFTASLSDPDSSDTLALCVEVDLLATGFSGAEDACGAGVAYSGTAVAASVTRTLAEGQYHWQARVRDAAGAYSGWISFGGGNAETVRDVGIDTTAPTAGAVYDGTVSGVDAEFNNGSLTSLSGNWSGFTDAGSGVTAYEYAVGTTPGGTETLGWTPSALTTEASPSALSLSTGVTYYLSVRAVDAAGNSVAATSDGQQVAPSLSLSINGVNAGVTCGDVVTTQATAPGSFPLGRLGSAAQRAIAGQNLTVTTNGAHGYAVYVSTTGSLVSAGGHTLADVPGTNASPADWPSAGTEAVGYTTSSRSLSGIANRFAGALWAAFASTAGEVMRGSGPATTGHSHCIAVGTSRAGNTPAGTYATILRYITVAAY